MSSRAEVEPKTLFGALAIYWSGLTLFSAFDSIVDLGVFPVIKTERRILEALAGAFLCWLMCLALRRADPRHAALRWLLVVVLSLGLGAVLLIAHDWAQYLAAGVTGGACRFAPGCTALPSSGDVVDDIISHGMMLLAWGALYLGLLASARSIAAERRASSARDAARLAELRALRFQLNPHFLFNALNSLANLVERRDNSAAASMIAEMGSFLRYGLVIDPLADVELDDEVEMQRRYLEIERIRFVQRLTVLIDIAPSLRRARIPSLLLQPLVENAVKHGVATTSAPVMITLSATPAPDGRMTIVVEDDAPNASAQTGVRFGIGLRNVSDRLDARFGDAAALTVTPRPGGGFRAEIAMPAIVL